MYLVLQICFLTVGAVFQMTNSGEWRYSVYPSIQAVGRPPTESVLGYMYCGWPLDHAHERLSIAIVDGSIL